MDDYMQVGSLIPMEDGWFMDAVTNKMFRMDDDGSMYDEEGELVSWEDYDEHDQWEPDLSEFDLDY